MPATGVLLDIVVANEVELLLDSAPMHSLREKRSRPARVAIVTGGRLDGSLKHALETSIAGSERTDIIGAKATLPRLLTDLRLRSRRVAVDIDEVAPRLRQVRLPREVIEADFVLATVDLRLDRQLRPDVVLGLWAELASPVHRFGARLSGHREGLTAELALAKPADRAIVFDQLFTDGPYVMVSGPDLVGIEVVILALRQLRTRSEADLPGPWEDSLVQRATELDLGAHGPEHLSILATCHASIEGPARQAIEMRINAAALRAGIDRISWH